MVWFLLRQPHADKLQDIASNTRLRRDRCISSGISLSSEDSRHSFGRIQRRLIHILAQEAEQAVQNLTTDVLPAVSSNHKFHPATKCNPRLNAWGVLFCFELNKESLARDGRKLRLECKPRNELAIDRFLARGGGFCCSSADATLKEVGLQDLCPANYSRTDQGRMKAEAHSISVAAIHNSYARTTADFVMRYLRKTETTMSEAIVPARPNQLDLDNLQC